MTKNDIDSYDDLKTFMFANRTTGDEEKVRQSQVQVQLVANDNAGNDGFRRVAMVIVTGEWAAVDTDTLTNCDLTSASIKGVSFNAAALTGATAQSTAAAAKLSPKAVTVNGMTEKQAAGGAAIKFSCVSSAKVDSVEFKASGDADYSTLANTKRTVEAGDKIRVVVKSLDEEHFKAYEFTIGVLAPATYANTTVAALGMTDGENGYTEDDWTDGTDVVLDTGAKTFDFPFLQTGDADKDKAQIEEAVAFYNESNVDDIVLSNLRKVGSIWYLSANGVDMSFDPTSGAVLTYTKADTAADTEVVKHIVASGAKVGASGGSGVLFDSDNTAEIGDLFNGEMTHIADIDAEEVQPGHTYVDKAYAVVQTLPTHAGAQVGLFTFTHSVAANDAVEAGDELLITATAKNDITLSTYAGTALSLTAASAVTEVRFNGADATVVNGTPTTTAITFVQTADKKILKDETITFKLVVPASALESGTITLPVVRVSSAT